VDATGARVNDNVNPYYRDENGVYWNFDWQTGRITDPERLGVAVRYFTEAGCSGAWFATAQLWASPGIAFPAHADWV